MMTSAQAMMLPDGKRLHLHHGPIDLIVEANGEANNVRKAYAQATRRFASILEELVGELPLLRREITIRNHGLTGDVSRAMARAVLPFSEHHVTPMAAVAGSVADEILSVMINSAPLSRAYVNNGGDIAVFLTRGQSFSVAAPAGPFLLTHSCRHPGESRDPFFTARTPSHKAATFEPWVPVFAGMTTDVMETDKAVRAATHGIATSGWRGRSFSLGIADAVTVVARSAASASAATMIANAVDLPGSPKVRRQPANEIAPDSDLKDRRVTIDVMPLKDDEIEAALARGHAFAEACIARGLINSATLLLHGTTKTATFTPPSTANEDRTLKGPPCLILSSANALSPLRTSSMRTAHRHRRRAVAAGASQ
jgi:uncharacterized protein